MLVKPRLFRRMLDHARGHARVTGRLASLALAFALAQPGEPAAQARDGRGAPPSPQPLSLSVRGEAEVVHDSGVTSCGRQRVNIDSPVRAFMDQFGTVRLTVADPSATAWQWVGTADQLVARPSAARLDCEPVMRGSIDNPDPSAFDQKTFVQSIFFDGSVAYAYGHQDFFGRRTELPGCRTGRPSADLPNCWYASIAVWRARPRSRDDAHLTFAPVDDGRGHVAIFPNVRFPARDELPRAGWVGYGTPTNIFRGRNGDGTPGGGWYMYVFASAPFGGQERGVCLFRSSNPADVSSWRAWNGDADRPEFAQASANPYLGPNRPCAVVNPRVFNNASFRTVLWHQASRQYVALHKDRDGLMVSTSRDLLRWSPPQDIAADDPGSILYPSLIDFDGARRGNNNFDEFYDAGNAFIYSRRSVQPGRTQIIRMNVRLSGANP